MDNKEFISNIVDNFFHGVPTSNLYRYCANRMLWEAIKQSDAQIIAQEDIVVFLLQQNAFFVLPEPLPAIINRNSIKYFYVDLGRDKFDIYRLFDQEPMYIIDCNFKWMIVLTTENTQSGTQLCVLVYSVGPGRFAGHVGQ